MVSGASKVCFGFDREKGKFGSCSGSADHIDVFLVGLDDFFGDGKAKTRSFFVFSSGRIPLIKAFPDFVNAFWGNSFPGILYRNQHLLMMLGGSQIDDRPRKAEFDGIVHQIVQHLLNPALICIYRKLLGSQG